MSNKLSFILFRKYNKMISFKKSSKINNENQKITMREFFELIQVTNDVLRSDHCLAMKDLYENEHECYKCTQKYKNLKDFLFPYKLTLMIVEDFLKIVVDNDEKILLNLFDSNEANSIMLLVIIFHELQIIFKEKNNLIFAENKSDFLTLKNLLKENTFFNDFEFDLDLYLADFIIENCNSKNYNSIDFQSSLSCHYWNHYLFFNFTSFCKTNSPTFNKLSLLNEFSKLVYN